MAKLPFIYSKPSESFDFEISPASKNAESPVMTQVSTDIDENINYVSKKFFLPKNGDVVTRETEFWAGNKKIRAFLISIDGLSDNEAINESVLEPLMNSEYTDTDASDIDYIVNTLIPYNQIKKTKDINDMINTINIGNASMFFDGYDTGIIIDSKSW